MVANIADRYNDYLKHAKYGDGYDILIHAVQTAYTVMGYIADENVERNSIQYGYYCVNTEAMTKKFQMDHNLRVTGIIDEVTWNTIFQELLNKNKCIVAQTGERQVSLFDVDTFLEENNNNSLVSSENIGVLGYTDCYTDNSIDDALWPGYNGDNITPSESGVTFDDFLNSLANTGIAIGEDNRGYITDGIETPAWDSDYIVNGNEVFDELLYNYIVNGGEMFGSMKYSYNIEGGETWHDDMVDLPNATGSDKDYDFIYNLLANSTYEGAIPSGPLWSSMSDLTNLDTFNHRYEGSTNRPYFHPLNLDKLRKSKFDINIVYGAKAEKSRKIIEVTPISVTQEVNASGEPIYDIYEFIAKDVVHGDSQIMYI